MSNDRFRFRVRDKRNQRYVDIFADVYNQIWRYYIDQSGDLIGVGEDNVDRILDRENFIVEQCTGRADKNGKLIFDGDVIQENGINRYIHWHDNGWCYSVRYNSQCHWPLRKEDVENAEIIGNIHDDQFRDATKMVEE